MPKLDTRFAINAQPFICTVVEGEAKCGFFKCILRCFKRLFS